MKILLVFVLTLITSCAYQPSHLKSNLTLSMINTCITKNKNIKNIQLVYIYINSFRPKLNGTKELRYSYNLNDYLLYSSQNCSNENYWYIESIETNYLSFTATSVIRNGIQLNVNITYVKNNKNILTRHFKITKENDFYSAWTATKKKTDEKIVLLLNQVFLEFVKQVSEISESLE